MTSPAEPEELDPYDVFDDWLRRNKMLQALVTDEMTGVMVHLIGSPVTTNSDWLGARPERSFVAVPVELLETAAETGAVQYSHGGRRMGLFDDACTVLVSDFDPDTVPGEHGPS